MGLVMVIKEDIIKVVGDLRERRISHMDISGFTVTIRLCNGQKKICLSTPVYFGDSYIPHSVRHSLSEKPSFSRGSLETDFHVDEDAFRIDLHYKGDVKFLEFGKFDKLLSEYGWLADNWRLHLDEHDRNDLVHVRN